MADVPADLSDHPRLKEIQLQVARAARDQAIAEARGASATADKAAFDAEAGNYPATAITPLDGSVTAGENIGVVAERVAYKLVAEECRRIVDAMTKAGETTATLPSDSKVLLVADPDLVTYDWPYVAISSALSGQRESLLQAVDALDEASPEQDKMSEVERQGLQEALSTGTVSDLAAPGPLPIAEAVAGGALSLLSAFRSNYSVSARNVTVGQAPVFAALSKELLGKGVAVTVDKFSLLGATRVFGDFEKALSQRLDVEQRATKLSTGALGRADRAAQEFTDAMNAYVSATDKKVAGDALKIYMDRLETAQKAADDAAGDDLDTQRDAVTVAQAAIKRFDDFATTVVQAPAAGGYPPLVAAAVRELLHSEEGGFTHVLYAGVEGAGGETIIRQRLWGAARARFIGTAQLSYMLWDVSEEKLVAAATKPLLGQISQKINPWFATDGFEHIPLT